MKKIEKLIYVMAFMMIMFFSPKITKASLVYKQMSDDCNNAPLVTLDNGIVSRTCKVYFEITEKDFNANQITFNFTLSNMTINSNSFTLEKGWKFISQTASSVTFQTTAPKFTLGTHNVGTITFYKINPSDTCRITLTAPTTTKVVRSCVYQDGNYYDKNGDIVDKTEFSRQCENHKCEVLTDGDNNYYFDDEGNETTKEKYEEKCQEHHYCEYQDGKYYDNDGNETDKTTYEKECEKHYCEKYDENTFYGKDGKETDKTTYEKECLSHKCEVLEDGTKYGKNGEEVDDFTYDKECGKHVCEVLPDNTHFGKDGTIVDEVNYKKECENLKCEVLEDGTKYDDKGNVVDEETYKQKCGNLKCEIVGDKYYDHKGNEVSKSEYDAFCGTVESPKTGLSLPIALLSIITILGISTLYITKKHNKFM